MKRILNIAIIISLLLVINVHADEITPVVNKVRVEITNKDGAYCYDYDGNKTTKTISYGKVIEVLEQDGSYLYGEDSCLLKKEDLKLVDNDEPTLSNKNLITICVLAGVLIAMGAFVTIILVNKRKEENTGKE